MSKKTEEKVKRSKLLNSCINGEGDLFSQIKNLRKSQPCVVSTMDGVTENVKEHFRDIHTPLFNSADDGEEIMKPKKEVEEKVDEKSLEHVNMVTPDIVREATKKS